MGDELYIDSVSKTIISKLSEEIAANVGTQISELIRGLLVQEITDIISVKIKTETENSSRLHVNNSVSDIKKHLDEKLEGHNRAAESELKAFIREELSSVRDALKSVDSHESLKGIIENQLASFTSKSQALIDNLSKSALQNADSPNNELKRYVEESFEKEEMVISRQVSTLKDEVDKLRQVLYSHIQRLESEAEMYSNKTIELERKIKEHQEIWDRGLRY
jgi:hypothetical protein